MADNWYPNRANFRSHEEWDAHVQSLNIIYAQKEKLDKAVADIKAVTERVQKSNVGQPSGGPLNTKIGGFSLIPGQPSNGDTLRFDSASQQWKLGP